MVAPLQFLKKKRKGSIRSIPVIIALLMLPLFFASVIGYKALLIIEELGLAQGFAIGLIDTLKTNLVVFDSIIIFIFAISFGAIIIRSFRLQTHPVLAIVGLIFLPVIVIEVAFTANVFGVFANIPWLATAVNQFPLTVAFYNNAALIALGSATLVLLIMVGGLLANR